MPRYIDIEPFETEVGLTGCCVQTTTHTGDGITVKATKKRDIQTIKAVPVEKLGKLGKLMIPYKGCPRGQMGRMCDATLEEEALYMGVITDEDGGKWVPVNEAVLRELIEKAKDRPCGEWGTIILNKKNKTVWIECSECGADFTIPLFDFGLCYHYCPNCGAKMDGEEQHGQD